MAEEVSLTLATFWESAAIAALIDAGLLLLISRLIRPERFFQIRLPAIVSAGVFWGILGVWVVRSYWVEYYQYFYPRWMGDWGIFVFGPAIGMVHAIIFYWIASWFRSHPLPVFFTLVGIEAFLEHFILGIFSFHIMEIPMFQGINPLSILVFSVPEYILYWSVILLLAFALHFGITSIQGGLARKTD